MLHRQRFALWVAATLIAALVLPAAAVPIPAGASQQVAHKTGIEQPLSPSEYADWLRTRVTAEELETRELRAREWLREWMATRTQRLPVDPARQSQRVAEWTVMVYIAADNNLEIAGLGDLNEMEAVGSSPDVNIVAQLDRAEGYTDWDGDWTETRRYYVQQDNNPDYITSPVVANLGEVNTGSPEAVADFATWAITTYPAEKYMLVLWDHGGAWISHASDEESDDELSLPQLQQALDRVLAETGIEQFEVIGFDMCLMGQLEVYQAIAPYARYGIGSEENEPGAGWFYVFLDELVRKPSMRGGELGRHVVDYFMYFLREVVGDRDVYGLATVDLDQIAALTAAVDDFAAAVAVRPDAALSPVADARNNTIAYGGFDDPQVQDFWSSIDLYQFADRLTDLNAPPDVQDAAHRVRAAVDSFVLYEDHVQALDGSHGVSIYFPMRAKVFNAFTQRYTEEVPSAMAGWHEFLNLYHGIAVATVTSAPQVTIVGVYPDVASIHNPAVVRLDISGRDIVQVNYAVGYFADGNTNERIVLDFDYLVSRTTTASGAEIVDWSDGVTTRTFQWEAEVPVLTDGTTSTYALLIPNRDNPDSALVNGYYQSVRGGKELRAQLIFDLNTQRASSLWGLNETASGNLQPFELAVEAGDTFTPEWLTLDANNELSGAGRGEMLTLTASLGVEFEKVPAPSGTYSLSFVAENVAGTTTLAEAVIMVDNTDLDPALRGYTDLTYGVNFLYPAQWIRPRLTESGRLFTADLATNTVLSLLPYTDVSSAEETDAAIRASWNVLDNLAIIQERSVRINELPAYVTDYTYDYQGSGRVGSVIAIYVPSQGVGYAFDLDAPAANLGPAQEALQALVDSITFFDPESQVGQSAWRTVTLLDGLVTFPVPVTWEEETGDGWTLYGLPDDRRVFIGLGADAATGQSNEELAQVWLDQLQQGVEGFNQLASEPYYIGGRAWHVVVFTYETDVPIGGAFFTTSAQEQDIVFWLEAPDAQFDQLFDDVFAVTIGGFAFGQ